MPLAPPVISTAWPVKSVSSRILLALSGSALDDLRRPVRRHVWNCAVDPRHLDQAGMRRRPLAEPRGATVARQHIGVAVLVQAAAPARMLRVEPGAGRELHDARYHHVGDDDAGEAGTAVVPHPEIGRAHV